MNMLTAAEQALASIPLPPAADELPCGAKTVQWEELDGSPANTRAAGPKASQRQRSTCGSSLAAPTSCRDEVQKLRTGAVVPLDNAAGDPVDLYAGGQLIARGEVLVLDGKFGSSRDRSDCHQAAET